MIGTFRSTRGLRDEGASAVEFALLVPLLLIVVFGIIAFGLLLFAQISATHAAREGARLAAVGVDDCDDWVDTVTTRAGGANTTATTLEITDTDGDGDVDPGDTAVATVEFSTSESANAALEAAVGIVSLVPGGGLVMPDTLTASAEARVERVKAETSC